MNGCKQLGFCEQRRVRPMVELCVRGETFAHLRQAEACTYTDARTIGQLSRQHGHRGSLGHNDIDGVLENDISKTLRQRLQSLRIIESMQTKYIQKAVGAINLHGLQV